MRWGLHPLIYNEIFSSRCVISNRLGGFSKEKFQQELIYKEKGFYYHPFCVPYVSGRRNRLTTYCRLQSSFLGVVNGFKMGRTTTSIPQWSKVAFSPIQCKKELCTRVVWVAVLWSLWNHRNEMVFKERKVMQKRYLVLHNYKRGHGWG